MTINMVLLLNGPPIYFELKKSKQMGFGFVKTKVNSFIGVEKSE